MLRPKNLYFLAAFFLAGSMVIYSSSLLKAYRVKAEEFLDYFENGRGELAISEEIILLPLSSPPINKQSDILKRLKVIVTAYSSSVWETDGDSFITASGETVRDGIVANNLLSFGTRVRLPELFGDKVFIVEDRMHSKKGYYHVDVWFPSREAALDFGAKLTEIEVLAY